nr:hypothetical protein [uncultured Lichenicoccus sp.]
MIAVQEIANAVPMPVAGAWLAFSLSVMIETVLAMRDARVARRGFADE